jgi:hypothetical protein
MSNQPKTQVLAAVQLKSMPQYRETFRKDPLFEPNIVTELEKVRDILDDPQQQADVLVLDNNLGDVHDMIKEVRQSYPRLIIILVDEDADFAMPGRADDVTTAPFKDNDLVTRIKRLNEDRRLQTLRADALPPVRQFAKSILKAGTAGAASSKQQAAVEAVKELGYDYVAFYNITPTDPPELSLIADVGESKEDAPRKLPYNDTLVGWVAQNGQSRTVGPEDSPNHPFVTEGRFKSAACVPVGTNIRFGVMLSCKTGEDSISQENVLMLELVSAQLASALAKDARG